MGTERETLLAASYHLLLPQHWGQQSKALDGSYCMIKHDKMIIK